MTCCDAQRSSRFPPYKTQPCCRQLARQHWPPFAPMGATGATALPGGRTVPGCRRGARAASWPSAWRAGSTGLRPPRGPYPLPFAPDELSPRKDFLGVCWCDGDLSTGGRGIRPPSAPESEATCLLLALRWTGCQTRRKPISDFSQRCLLTRSVGLGGDPRFAMCPNSFPIFRLLGSEVRRALE